MGYHILTAILIINLLIVNYIIIRQYKNKTTKQKREVEEHTVKVGKDKEPAEPKIGMTPADIKAVWGVPAKVSTTETSYGTNTLWIYNEGMSNLSFIFFEDGKVNNISKECN